MAVDITKIVEFRRDGAGIQKFLMDMRSGFVQRWHARQTVRQESLAAHHHQTSRNARLVADALRYFGIAEPDVFKIVSLADFHDEAEKVTGDVSGEAKRRFPELRAASKGAEMVVIDQILFSELPEPIAEQYRAWARLMAQEPGTLEQQVVKYADKLAAYQFALTEIRIGNTLMADVVEEVAQELRELDWPWLIELRKVGAAW